MATLKISFSEKSSPCSTAGLPHLWPIVGRFNHTQFVSIGVHLCLIYVNQIPDAGPKQMLSQIETKQFSAKLVIIQLEAAKNKLNC